MRTCALFEQLARAQTGNTDLTYYIINGMVLRKLNTFVEFGFLFD